MAVVKTPAGRPDTETGKDAQLRILMVDDDALILMLTVELLKDMGYDVTSADSGAKALQILESDDGFDLLITDMSMPHMNGMQLALAVKAFLPELPILLATGGTDLDAASDLQLPQLAKPYSEFDLQAAIDRLVGQTG